LLDLSDRIRDHFMVTFGLPDSAALKLVSTSRTSMADGLGKLLQAVAESDVHGVSHWSHSLKGNLLNSGLSEFAVLAAAIEERSEAGVTDSEDIRENLVRLKAGLSAFISGQ